MDRYSFDNSWVNSGYSHIAVCQYARVLSCMQNILPQIDCLHQILIILFETKTMAFYIYKFL